ncbi:MAG: hypothetical protein ACRENC_07250 [Gemmatimonadaceae bacterium]
MARVQHSTDRHPGTLPDIRSERDGTTYVMAPPGTRTGKHLVIRCDANGEIWVSIQPPPRATGIN